MLHAAFLLADVARAAPDGTFGMLRAGIDQFECQRPQLLVRASAVARLTAGSDDDLGKHRVAVVLARDSGVMKELYASEVLLEQAYRSVNLIGDIGLELPTEGMYELRLLVGDRLASAIPFRVSFAKVNAETNA